MPTGAPFKSQKQARLMYAVASNPEVAKERGIPQSVGKKLTGEGAHQKIGQLPERVQHKAKGGVVRAAKPFKW